MVFVAVEVSKVPVAGVKSLVVLRYTLYELIVQLDGAVEGVQVKLTELAETAAATPVGAGGAAAHDTAGGRVPVPVGGVVDGEPGSDEPPHPTKAKQNIVAMIEVPRHTGWRLCMAGPPIDIN